jgi:hypothetical protein
MADATSSLRGAGGSLQRACTPRHHPGMGPPNLPAKVCATCGRTFAWRKKWARQWAEVVHCSDRCRSRRKRDETIELETRILALLAQRARGATICPSEVLPDEEKQDANRMESVRAAARRLGHGARIDILQRGGVVDPDHARGPIRLRLR